MKFFTLLYRKCPNYIFTVGVHFGAILHTHFKHGVILKHRVAGVTLSNLNIDSSALSTTSRETLQESYRSLLKSLEFKPSQ